MQWYGEMPDEVTLTVNGNHPIYKNILAEQAGMKEKQVHNLADLALLSQGLLKGNDLTEFINRSIDLLEGEVRSKMLFKLIKKYWNNKGVKFFPLLFF